MTRSLPKPCQYTPFDTGHYAFNVGLSPLRKDFGNGTSDSLLFQLDDQFDNYRANKRLLRDNLHLYGGIHETCTTAIMGHTCETIAHNLQRAYPGLFKITHESNTHHLDCTLTGDYLSFDNDWNLKEHPDYSVSLDALASQVQEDLAIVKVDALDEDRLVACNICAPSGWDPSAKLGKSFTEIHRPIPEMDAIKEASSNILFNLTRPGSNQRFVWSVTFDNQLNHHPDVMIPGRIKAFSPDTGELYARVERQVIHGLSEILCFLFTIRTYIYPVRQMKPDLQVKLKEAIFSQTPAMLNYKGIEDSIEAIAKWFERI